MSKHALIEHRPWLLASVVAATAYYFLSETIVVEPLEMLLKGAGVGLLAAYAMRRTNGIDGAILVLALALSAAADMVLITSFSVGGGLFFASHLVAIALYLRNSRDTTTVSQKLFAATLVIGTPIISYLLSVDPMIALYSVALGAMGAAAWMSRFPRYRVGIGAVLFVISDWLIFSREGAFDLGVLPELFIWPLYYAGQLMIATGVVQTLRGERPAR